MENLDVDLSHRPIVVGYAFGAKKMRSMGMVMAEASKSLFYPPIHELDDDFDEGEDIVVIDLEKKQKLHQVVRHFQQSCCSSMDGGGDANSSAGGLTTTTISDHHSGLTVSFVPLDPDKPIEDQHCGQIDVIIHKLTEDILAWEDNDRASRRVERLLHFCDKNNCLLVDDPRAVRAVLSRATIASTLMSLQGLTTVSGIQVSTPPFSTSACFSSLRYPVIAKPLTAAGTKSSHSMKVLLRKPRHEVFQEPLLFQEYINHDAVLYKIYVLGDNISVFERSSLPNLPSDQTSTLGAVEFDSQRHPYPSLASFGFDQAAVNRSSLRDRLNLTAAEIQPVVNALKEAFQLQLFGFDVIHGMEKLWIVDVNYFPSYKEVSNFPALLAEYLTGRVLSQREHGPNE